MLSVSLVKLFKNEYCNLKTILFFNLFLVLTRAIHSLGKIGEDLYIEAQEDGLALRTMNSSRSAFVSYLFNPGFFSSYDPERILDPPPW